MRIVKPEGAVPENQLPPERTWVRGVQTVFWSTLPAVTEADPVPVTVPEPDKANSIIPRFTRLDGQPPPEVFVNRTLSILPVREYVILSVTVAPSFMAFGE